MGANSVKTIGQDGTLSANSAIVTADGTVLAENARRLWWGIVNLDTDAVLVKLGAGASAVDFNIPLKACAVTDDGSGGAFFDDTHTGIVSIKASAGAPRVSVIEMNKEF